MHLQRPDIEFGSLLEGLLVRAQRKHMKLEVLKVIALSPDTASNSRVRTIRELTDEIFPEIERQQQSQDAQTRKMLEKQVGKEFKIQKDGGRMMNKALKERVSQWRNR